MIERADQVVLDYLSQVADASHQALTPEQRMDFLRRLRARIEELRGNSESEETASKIVAQFGDPLELVQREARKIQDEAGTEPAGPEEEPATQVIAPVAPTRQRLPGQGLPGSGLPGTQWVPPPMGRDTPGVSQELQAARSSPRASPRNTRRPADAMEPAGPVRPGTLDARALFEEHRHGVLAIAALLVAAVLAPMPLPRLAIFPIWVVVWAAAAAATLTYGAWIFRDRLIGALLPMAVFVAGGLTVGISDASQGSLFEMRVYAQAFTDVGAVMFIVGALLGAAHLTWRLVRPLAPARPVTRPRLRPRR